MKCPFCGHNNIEGDDSCSECGQSLVEFQNLEGELEQSITRHPIGAIATKDPISVPSYTSVRNAIEKMVESGIGCLLVENDSQLSGVFTERDVLNRITDDLSTLDDEISDHMTPDPIIVSEQDSIAYALQLMSSGGYRHLPVSDSKGCPIGIVSARDILRVLAIRFASIRE